MWTPYFGNSFAKLLAFINTACRKVMLEGFVDKSERLLKNLLIESPRFSVSDENSTWISPSELTCACNEPCCCFSASMRKL